jgi:hypothetical protein
MKRIRVSSSAIESVGYDSKTRTLEIKFTNGGVYQYFPVSPRVHRELLRAESHGSYINHEIKNIYRYRTVRKPSD